MFIRLNAGQPFSIDYVDNEKISLIKEKIKSVNGTPVENQRLFYNEVLLDDSKSLIDYEIKSDSNIDLDINN